MTRHAQTKFMHQNNSPILNSWKTEELSSGEHRLKYLLFQELAGLIVDSVGYLVAADNVADGVQVQHKNLD